MNEVHNEPCFRTSTWKTDSERQREGRGLTHVLGPEFAIESR